MVAGWNGLGVVGRSEDGEVNVVEDVVGVVLWVKDG